VLRSTQQTSVGAALSIRVVDGRVAAIVSAEPVLLRPASTEPALP
jgi:hypothetical protein